MSRTFCHLSKKNCRMISRGPNISILHLRGSSDSRDSPSLQQSSTFQNSGGQVKVNSSSKTSRSSSYARGSTTGRIEVSNSGGSNQSSNKQQQRNQDGVQTRRREDSFLSGSGGTSGELFASGNCSRELSPVRWCDREVDGVYLGRSGWVQVQQRSLDENRKANYESGIPAASTGTLPLPRRSTVKLADYHCSNSEPGNCPEGLFSRPGYLALHGQDYDGQVGSGQITPPHVIPESFSPPSVTPIISPPPAFQDSAKGSRSSHGRMAFGKPPFLPRSNAIVDSDVISPPPSPSPSPLISPSQGVVNWAMASSPVNPGRRRQMVTSPSGPPPYRLAQAKSLEDPSGNRRSQFVQRYKDSSSSSSSSMGFRSLDSCVNRGVVMPRLAENTDSSIEGYEDGDEDDNPSSSANPQTMSGGVLNSPGNGSEKISPSGRPARVPLQYHCSRVQMPRRSPGSIDTGKQIAFNSPSSSSSSSAERQGRSPTPNPGFRKNNNSNSRTRMNASSSPDSLQTRVRRSRSLQLPERKSPASAAPTQNREHFRDSGNEPHRVVVKIAAANPSDRNKRLGPSNREYEQSLST